MAQQTPSAYERRGGRFSVNRPGNREILAVLLEMFTGDCTLFHIEYLPAITSFLYVFILKMKACTVKSRSIRSQNRRNGVLEVVGSGPWML